MGQNGLIGAFYECLKFANPIFLAFLLHILVKNSSAGHNISIDSEHCEGIKMHATNCTTAKHRHAKLTQQLNSVLENQASIYRYHFSKPSFTFLASKCSKVRVHLRTFETRGLVVTYKCVLTVLSKAMKVIRRTRLKIPVALTTAIGNVWATSVGLTLRCSPNIPQFFELFNSLRRISLMWFVNDLSLQREWLFGTYYGTLIYIYMSVSCDSVMCVRKLEVTK